MFIVEKAQINVTICLYVCVLTKGILECTDKKCLLHVSTIIIMMLKPGFLKKKLVLSLIYSFDDIFLDLSLYSLWIENTILTGKI